MTNAELRVANLVTWYRLSGCPGGTTNDRNALVVQWLPPVPDVQPHAPLLAADGEALSRGVAAHQLSAIHYG